jgi:hypothetical protein
MMPYTYPSRTCITHGCMFEKQPHVGSGDYCFKHAEMAGELPTMHDFKAAARQMLRYGMDAQQLRDIVDDLALEIMGGA